MSKQKRKQNRADILVEMVSDSIAGKPSKLVNELDAIVDFLRMWERDYGSEDQPRLAMITGMIADLATIIAAQESLRDEACGDIREAAGRTRE